MKTNPHLKAAILEVVDNQIRDNDPPETKKTFNRLMKEGNSSSAFLIQVLGLGHWKVKINIFLIKIIS